MKRLLLQFIGWILAMLLGFLNKNILLMLLSFICIWKLTKVKNYRFLYVLYVVETITFLILATCTRNGIAIGAWHFLNVMVITCSIALLAFNHSYIRSLAKRRRLKYPNAFRELCYASNIENCDVESLANVIEKPESEFALIEKGIAERRREYDRANLRMRAIEVLENNPLACKSLYPSFYVSSTYTLSDYVVDEILRSKDNIEQREREEQQNIQTSFSQKILNDARRNKYYREFLRKRGRKVADVAYCLEHLNDLDNYAERMQKQEDEARRTKSRQEELERLCYPLKNEGSAIKRYLKEKRVRCFYHFTDRKNLESIKKQQGLFSWQYLKTHGIRIHNQGGDELSESLDLRYGLADYVRLSFCENHPMARRKRLEGANIVVLKISIDVAMFGKTLFSDVNATDAEHRHGGDLQALKWIDIDATQRTYVSRDDFDFKYHQAEVMVKTCIPIKYIMNIDSC